jgi:hypothetical protein
MTEPCLKRGYQDLKKNEWFEADCLEKRRSQLWAASDASEDYLGWVLYGITGRAPSLRVPETFCRPSMKTDARPEEQEWWRSAPIDQTTKKQHIFGLEVKAACELIKSLCSKKHAGMELVIGIDNSASRCAINRGLSANVEANAAIEEALILARNFDVLVTTVGVPGIYNIADYPTRPTNFEDVPIGAVKKVLSAAEKKRGLEAQFDPWEKTWEVMRAEWLGHRLNLSPEELEEREGNTLIHTEYAAPVDSDEEENECLGVKICDAVQRGAESLAPEEPSCKRRRLE